MELNPQEMYSLLDNAKAIILDYELVYPRMEEPVAPQPEGDPDAVFCSIELTSGQALELSQKNVFKITNAKYGNIDIIVDGEVYAIQLLTEQPISI